MLSPKLAPDFMSTPVMCGKVINPSQLFIPNVSYFLMLSNCVSSRALIQMVSFVSVSVTCIVIQV